MIAAFNARLPKLSHDQIADIASQYGLTKTQVLILAIDRLCRDLNPNAADGRAITEALLLSDNGDESGHIEQA
jgi:hypothetical protein